MSKNAVMPLDDYVSACDNIREKIGTEDLIKSGELAGKVDAVYEAGHTQGEREMWDAITANNTRKDISMLFAESNFEYIRPPYKIIPTGATTLNQPFAGAKNLKKVESDYFDFSQKKTGTYSQTGCYFTFYGSSKIEEIEDLGIQPDFGYYTTYANCNSLKKIAVIRSDENTVFSATFNYCNALEYVRFEGVIGQNGLNFQWSKKLNAPSCHSIFTHLKDFRQNIVDNYSIPTDTQGSPIAEYTLIAGQKYSGHYQNDAIGGCDFSGVAQYADVPIKGERLAVTFELVDPMGTPYNVFVYNENGSLCIFDTSIVSLERYITISTITETRTITMPTTVRDNGNATPEDIAEATERGWSIVWA